MIHFTRKEVSSPSRSLYDMIEFFIFFARVPPPPKIPTKKKKKAKRPLTRGRQRGLGACCVNLQGFDLLVNYTKAGEDSKFIGPHFCWAGF